MNKGRTRATKLSYLTYREVNEYLIKTWVSHLKSKKEKGKMIFGSCFIDERDNTDLLPCLFCSTQMWWCIFQYICIKFKFYYFHTERIPQISFLLKKILSFYFASFIYATVICLWSHKVVPKAVFFHPVQGQVQEQVNALIQDI